jgi:guanosine-3',5'-bis(diphosphate) 3'-pyrophosphohydrolase
MTVEDIFKASKFPLSNEGRKFIAEAYKTAEFAHRGQKRKSGDDYIVHCLETAKILAEIGMESRTIAAGLLHDVPEDTAVTLDEIRAKFGDETAYLVDGITKLSRIRLRGSKEEYYLENLRKMFLAMAADIRVVIIKLADRLHNMRTLEHHGDPEKQKRIARETMEIYAPIANRLGIGEIKGELEDLCFRHLEPENYDYVSRLIEGRDLESRTYIDKAVRIFREDLQKEGVSVTDINGRAKHLYRLFQKLRKHDMELGRIYDLLAIRIIVPDIVDCYEALGVVHKKHRPMVGRIKDYISLPKPNGYQSLHTTVFGPDSRIIEVQIRTQKMHDEAEFGIAAHWIYTEKERKSWRNLFSWRKGAIPNKELAWVKQLQEWQKEIGRDDQEFMEGLKIDFFKNHIFAFTPRGDIIDLPEDATPVDFAYAIHSEVGNRATGAKADGKMVPLDYHIQNGQVIEILTTKEKRRPGRDWLQFAKTSVAKSHIRRQLKKHEAKSFSDKKPAT